MELKEPKGVTVAAHVSFELAEKIRRLAEVGNRSISREVAAAIREHVEREQAAA